MKYDLQFCLHLSPCIFKTLKIRIYSNFFHGEDENPSSPLSSPFKLIGIQRVRSSRWRVKMKSHIITQCFLEPSTRQADKPDLFWCVLSHIPMLWGSCHSARFVSTHSCRLGTLRHQGEPIDSEPSTRMASRKWINCFAAFNNKLYPSGVCIPLKGQRKDSNNFRHFQ